MNASCLARTLHGLLVLPLVLCAAMAATAQVPAGTIPAQSGPWAIAVDPVANRIYATNYLANSLTAIDGATHAAVSFATGAAPVAVAVNPATGRVYVANAGGNVTMLDGASTSTIAAGITPLALAVNAVTNRIYVINGSSHNVTVIDGATSATTNVAVGTAPRGIAVNPVTNKVYVANAVSNSVTVIDGATLATSTVAVGAAPIGVAVDPVRNRIYVTRPDADSVVAIDGETHATSVVATADYPLGIAVNPATGKIYALNKWGDSVTVIDPATLAPTTVPVGNNPTGIAINVVTDRIYVTSELSNSLTAIDGATLATTTVTTGSSPVQVGVNPVTNRAYVTSFGGNSITVFDGSVNAVAPISAGTTPVAIAVDPVRSRVYVANRDSDSVTIVDAQAGTTASVTVGDGPRGIAVDTVHDRIYTADHGSGTVTVIDGTNRTTSTVGVGGTPHAVAVNPVTRKVYVAAGTRLVEIDGLFQTISVLADSPGAAYVAVAVNVVTNKLYAADLNNDLVAAMNPSGPLMPMGVGVGDAPVALAVDDGFDRIYCANSGSNTVTVINGVTLATETVAAQNTPRAIAVNPATHQVFVTNYWNATVTVIDAGSLTTHTVPTGANPQAVAVNPVANRIYVANEGSDATVIDGPSLESASLSTGASRAVALDPVTGKVYFARSDLAVVTPSTPALDKHRAFVSMPGGAFTSVASPVLSLGWQLPYAPVNPPVRTVYYRLDDGQHAFAASGGGPYAATLAALRRGQHYVVAFVADAMEGAAINTTGNNSGGSSPIVGAPRIVPIYAVNPPAISNAAALPAGHPGVPYSQLLMVTGGVGGESFAVTSGALPAGLAIDASGTLAGTPTQGGTFNFTVTVTDNSGGSGSKAFSLQLLAGPAIATTPPVTQSFGTVATGYSSAQVTIVVINLGDAALVVGMPTITGTYAADFSLASSTCASVAPSRSCAIRLSFSPSSSGFRSATLQIPSNDAAVPVKTLALTGTGAAIADTTPDAFAFTDVSGVPIASTQVSAPVTILGINAPAAISVSGGAYSIGCNDIFATAASTVFNGQAVCVRHTASASYGTSVHTVLTVGGVSGTFTSTTMPAYTLSVSLLGAGSGTVTGPGIDCPDDCSQAYGAGGVASLVAAPAAGSSFAGWGGDCSGTGACEVTMDAARAVSATFDVVAPPDPPRLGNISTRMQVLTGNDVMIGGFVIGGAASKTVVVRARGPSLVPYGIANALANPTLQLVRSSDQATIATNDDWQSAPNAAEVVTSGFAPSNDLESAVLASLPPGAYTAIVAGQGNTTGVGIVEVFEVDGPGLPLANISTRGQVLTGNDVMIGGFVITGSGSQTVVVRARGPSLIPYGIANALADPVLQLVRSSDQQAIAANDDWASAPNAADLVATGFAPSNALESAILVTLPPGAYTAIVTGVANGTGVGIVEVFAN